MSIWNKMFGSSSEKKSESYKKILPWQELTALDQLVTIEENSNQKLQAIFKHSTRCGISKMALSNFERSFDLTENELDLYYLDLLNYRDISAEIAAKFQVFHESPQFIVIKNGVTVHHASHGTISPQVLHQFV